MFSVIVLFYLFIEFCIDKSWNYNTNMLIYIAINCSNSSTRMEYGKYNCYEKENQNQLINDRVGNKTVCKKNPSRGGMVSYMNSGSQSTAIVNALNRLTLDQQRVRKNSQSSAVSRDNSSERSFSMRPTHRRSRQNSYNRNYENSRDSSLDHENHLHRGEQQHQSRRNFNNRYYGNSREQSKERRQRSWSRSRENSAQPDSLNWRMEMTGSRDRNNRNHNTRDLAGSSRNNITCDKSGKQIVPGVLKLPTNIYEINKELEALNQESRFEISQFEQKTLFDPKNPNKPIVVKKVARNYVPPTERSKSPIQSRGEYDIADNDNNYCFIRPSWYSNNSKNFNLLHNTGIISQLEDLDSVMQKLFINNQFLQVSIF